MAKKTTVRKASTTKKSVVKKSATKKSAGRASSSAKAASTKNASTKKSPAKKPPAKKPPAKTSSANSLVAVGATAPEFTLPDAGGKPVSLSTLKGKPVVVYFYPKDDTSGCTAEACDFRDNLQQFRKLGCTVIGISPDSVKSHAKFAAKYKLTVTLLADEPDAAGVPAVCTAYGVWQEKSMYGRAYMGVVRTTYIIDANGKVAHRFDKVSVTGHVDEVLSAVKSLA
ncbi:MAG: thioredoxin-dependent thiol peroxidase [Phycisphaerales bacterium]